MPYYIMKGCSDTSQSLVSIRIEGVLPIFSTFSMRYIMRPDKRHESVSGNIEKSIQILAVFLRPFFYQYTNKKLYEEELHGKNSRKHA